MPKKINIEKNILEEISHKYNNGQTLKSISNEYGYSTDFIRDKLREKGLYISKIKHLTNEELENIKNDYLLGMNAEQLSQKYNRNSCVIINSLTKIGIYKKVRNYWSKNEIDILKKYYSIIPTEEILPLLPKRDINAIFTKASELKLPHYNTWTKNEIEILKKYYGKLNVSEIEEMLDKKHSISSIKTKAQRIGLTKSIRWDEEDEKIVIENYPKLPIENISEMLPNKSKMSIIGIARKHNLKSKFYLDTYYSEESKKFIYENWNTISDDELAKIFNKTPQSIMEQRHNMGLYKIKHDYSNYKNFDRFLRGQLQFWKNESMKSCEYKCILTGDKDFAIHHIYGFNLILCELYEYLESKNIIKSYSLTDYSKNELDNIIKIFHEIHSKYPLGVCVKKEIHNLFHSIYGSGSNNEEQWNNFIRKYKNGEYLIK